MSEDNKTQTEEQLLMQRVIEREKQARQKEEVKQFLDSELMPDKFGPAKETAEYLKTKGILDEIFQRSPELELLAVGPNRDANRLRETVLKRGQEIVKLKETEAEAARVKAEADKLKQGIPPAKPSDAPVVPSGAVQQPAERTNLFAWEKDFATKLREAGVSEEKIQLALLSGRDY